MIGRRFGKLVVTEEAPRDKWGHRRYFCKCDCGGNRVIGAGELKRGDTRSCGCLRRKANKERLTRHGHAAGRRTPTYRSWRMMMTRCGNPNNRDYKEYGERGIVVCERWHKFQHFLEDMGERPEGMTLDRINPDGNYEPGNCRWADYHIQRINQRRMRGEPAPF